MSNITDKPIPFSSSPAYIEGGGTLDLKPNVYNTIIQIDASDKTINLPALSEMIDGYSIAISSSENGTMTFIPHGSDTIANTVELLVSKNTLPSCYILASKKNNNWSVIAGGASTSPASTGSATLYCGGQTITPTNTPVPVIWTDVISNLSGMWNPLDPTKLRQPTGVDSGMYLVEYVIRWSGSPAGTRESFIRPNGNTDSYGWHRDQSIGNLTRNGFAIIQMSSPTDYIELCASTSVIVPLNSGAGGANPRSAQSANRITIKKIA
jgi:hypothetical protein